MSNSSPESSELFHKLTRLKTWENFLYNTPCIASNLLWGFGIGTLMAAHKLKMYPGSYGRAVNAAVFGFLAVSGSGYYVCTRKNNEQRAAMHYAAKQSGMVTESPFASRIVPYGEDNESSSSSSESNDS